MKALGKLKALVLVFAVLALILGFAALYAPHNVQAKPPCKAWCMYCTVEPPIYCWEACCLWGYK